MLLVLKYSWRLKYFTIYLKFVVIFVNSLVPITLVEMRKYSSMFVCAVVCLLPFHAQMAAQISMDILYLTDIQGFYFCCANKNVIIARTGWRNRKTGCCGATSTRLYPTADLDILSWSNEYFSWGNGTLSFKGNT